MAHEDLPPIDITSGAIRFNTDSMKLEYFHLGMEGGPSSASYAGIGTMAAGEWVNISTTSPDILTAGTRCVIGGGYTPSGQLSNIDYFNVNTTGNTTDWGSFNNSRRSSANISSSTRGVFAGGYAPGGTNTMSTITISSTGNGKNFGDLYSSLAAPSGLSDSHGGIS